MIKFNTILFLSILACSCQPSKSKEDKPVTQTHDVDSMFRGFISHSTRMNKTTINDFIHPDNGLWLIQSSGAMVSFTHTSQVDKNFPIDLSNLEQDTLPLIDCETKTFWTKEGCFAHNSQSLSNSKIWVYTALSKEDKAKIAALAATVQWTVITTTLNACYYFSLINGKWYLSFVDLRKPCSA